MDSSAIRILRCLGSRIGCAPQFFSALSVSSVVKGLSNAFTTEDTEATEQTKNEMELRRQLSLHGRCFAG